LNSKTWEEFRPLLSLFSLITVWPVLSHTSASISYLFQTSFQIPLLEKMNVDRHNFPTQLFLILSAIADADFIAIDFEFSGVASNINRSGSRSFATLQERYDEVRAASAKYSVIQVGITTAHLQFPSTTQGEGSGNRNNLNVSEDSQTFELKTWNIDLCPILEEEFGVNRDFSLQSGAAQFLLANRFDFHRPFAQGVRWMSRNEEKEAQKAAKLREDPGRFQQIQLKPEEVESLAFVERIRSDVRKWMSDREPGKTLLITSRLVKSNPDNINKAMKGVQIQSPDSTLTRFDRKLVHQLLRAEFPDLAARMVGANMIISRIDVAKETQFTEAKRRRIQEQINNAVGFRWIVEALCGGNIQEINLKSLALEHNEPIASVSSRHEHLMKKLKATRPVLVGHNVFGDLMYLYQNFLGDLPEKVEEFSRLVTSMFPVVIDTKYMATEELDLSSTSSLDQIGEVLKNEPEPRICKTFQSLDFFY
jgi:poly(A)-specific ribonuclease